MTTYTSAFGGQTLPPSEYQFRAFNLTADVTLAWPDNTDGTDLVATLMNVTPSGGVWTITLPPANEVSTGRDFLIRNLGAVSLNVADNAAGALATIAAGESRYFYITDNSTAAGTWSVFTYGTGSSAADASALAGYGLTVLSGELNTDLPITSYGAGVTIAAADRAQFLVYQGGTTTWYFPDPATLPNGFFCAINNAGTGTLTLDAKTAGGYIDESNTKTLQPSESCFVVSKGDATGYFTVGYGRSSTFAFTQLAVDVTGTGGITITSAQATNKLWYFYNTAGGDRTVTIPAVASVYFVRVGAIGAGNDLTFTTGSDSTVSLSANQSYTIYCDGTNVVSAQTVAVTSTVALDDGSAASPSLNFSLDTDTGLYRSTTNVLGIAANGAMVATFGTAGLTLATALSVANGGTGATTLTGYVKGNGTSAMTASATVPVGDVGGLGTGVATALGVNVGTAGSVVVNGGALGTPSSGTLTNATGLPISTGVSGLGANVAAFLGTPTSANLAAALTDETGTGAAVFANTPTLVTPILGTPTSGTMTNVTGLPLTTGVTGVLPVANGGTNSTTFDTNLLSGKMYAAATGTDTYAVTLSPAPASYVEGMTVFFKSAGTNTGASTLNVNALGAKAVQNPDGTALGAGVIVSGGVYMATYDGTQFKLNRGPTGATGATGPAGQSTSYSVSTQTATASQTVFNIAYTVGLIDVYQNGARLIPTTDYTASNGTSVTLTTGATVNDELTFVVWTYVSVANALTAADIGASVQGYNANTAVGPGTSVDSEIALFSGTGGKTLKRASTTGILKATSGVIGAAVSGTDIKTVNGTSLLGSGDITVGGGSWIYLSTVTASNSATVDIETTFDSTYDAYVIVASGVVVATDNVYVGMRFKVSGNYVTSLDYQHASITNSSATAGSTVTTLNSNGNDAIYLIGNDMGNAAGESGSWKVSVHNPSSTSLAKQVYFDGVRSNTSGQPSMMVGVGAYKIATGTPAITGIRFFASSGNITSGTFRLYGIKNS